MANDVVFLGNDVTFGSCEDGGAEDGGLGLHDSNGDVFLNNDLLSCTSIGYGPAESAWADAWVGNPFTVSGPDSSASQYASIIANIGYTGELFAGAAAASSFSIHYRVKELSTGTIYGPVVIDSGGGSALNWEQFTGDVAHAITVPLDWGNDYRPEILLSTDASAATVGGATSDFGKVLGASYEGVDSQTFEVIFI